MWIYIPFYILQGLGSKIALSWNTFNAVFNPVRKKKFCIKKANFFAHTCRLSHVQLFFFSYADAH